MAEVYRPRHPERIVLYRVLFHYFERFVAEYESHFEKEYGFLRPIIKEVVDRSIQHLKLTFAADKPPPPHVAYQEVLVAAAAGSEPFL